MYLLKINIAKAVLNTLCIFPRKKYLQQRNVRSQDVRLINGQTIEMSQNPSCIKNFVINIRVRFYNDINLKKKKEIIMIW